MGAALPPGDQKGCCCARRDEEDEERARWPGGQAALAEQFSERSGVDGTSPRVLSGGRAPGSTVAELHENIRCQAPGFEEALGIAARVLSMSDEEAASRISRIAEVLRTGRGSLETALTNPRQTCGPSAEDAEAGMQLHVEASSGVVVSAEDCLARAGKQGYHMVGCTGKAAPAAAATAEVFAGRHREKSSAMIVLCLSFRDEEGKEAESQDLSRSFIFEYVFPLEVSSPRSSAGGRRSPRKREKRKQSVFY